MRGLKTEGLRAASPFPLKVFLSHFQLAVLVLRSCSNAVAGKGHPFCAISPMLGSSPSHCSLNLVALKVLRMAYFLLLSPGLQHVSGT